MTNISSISSNSIATLFSAGSPLADTSPQAANKTSAAMKLLATGGDGNGSGIKTGSAMATIMDILAAQNDGNKAQKFVGAKKVDLAPDSPLVQMTKQSMYSVTVAGNGAAMSDADMQQIAVTQAQQEATGTGAAADEARAFLTATANGTVEHIDMSAFGVTSTYTSTTTYYADGREAGGSDSYKTQGVEEFLAANTVVGSDGLMHDKATGKYATLDQNGTQFSYVLF